MIFDIRETVAHLYGLAAAQLDAAAFERAYVELTRSFREKSLEFQGGGNSRDFLFDQILAPVLA